MCHSSLSSHGPFISPAPFNVRPVFALHDLSPRLRFSAGPGDALYRATRCGVIFYRPFLANWQILLDGVLAIWQYIPMDDGEGREHGPTGPSTNANPPDIPPERQGGPEQSGCGSKRGPTASANEAHKGGYPDGGKDRSRQAAQRDGGRIKQGDERCGRWGR